MAEPEITVAASGTSEGVFPVRSGLGLLIAVPWPHMISWLLDGPVRDLMPRGGDAERIYTVCVIFGSRALLWGSVLLALWLVASAWVRRKERFTSLSFVLLASALFACLSVYPHWRRVDAWAGACMERIMR